MIKFALPYIITEVVYSSGVRGYGESRESVQMTGETHESILGVITSRFAPELHGMNPFDIEAAHDTTNAICCGNTAAKSAVD